MDYFVIALDPDGSQLWALNGSSPGEDEGWAIAVDPTGICATVGWVGASGVNGTIRFGSHTLPLLGFKDVLVGRIGYDASGAPYAMPAAWEPAPRIAPNPTSGAARLAMTAERRTDLRVELLDPIGRLVTTPFVGDVGPGEVVIPIDTRALASGLYFCRVIDSDGARLLPLDIRR